jgi:energy-coupling factor transporter ATP-binding protein EcfA2
MGTVIAETGGLVSDACDRIAIVGAPGAGKSTLARHLAANLDAHHIELDALHFLPGWKLRPEEAIRADVSRAVTAERWVACGNWNGVRDLVWSRATCVIWLDYPLHVCFQRLLSRTLARCWSSKMIHNGNHESFTRQFFSSGSLLLYLLRIHRPKRRELQSVTRAPEWNHLVVHHLRSPREVKALLQKSSFVTRQ